MSLQAKVTGCEYLSKQDKSQLASALKRLEICCEYLSKQDKSQPYSII